MGYCRTWKVSSFAGNKTDLYVQRQVDDEEGENFAKSIGAFFGETSAKNDSGITNLFENIAFKILDPGFNNTYNVQKAKEENDSRKTNIKIETVNNKDNSNKKQKKCC